MNGQYPVPMDASPATRPPHEHESAAEQWSRARSLLMAAVERHRAMSLEVDALTKQEEETWRRLTQAAGREMPPIPVLGSPLGSPAGGWGGQR